jgi:hypothetical protein
LKVLIAFVICLLLAGCVYEGGKMRFKFVTSGQAIDDAAVTNFILRGNSLKPLAPVNLKGTRDAAGNLLIEWTRRSRIGAGMMPGSDVPVAEEQEVYLIEIMDGSAVKRPITEKTGGSHQAVLQPIIGGQYISGNNLLTPSPDYAIAAVAQRLDNGGFVEATLSFSGDYNNVADIGLATPEFLPFLSGQGTPPPISTSGRWEIMFLCFLHGKVN